MSPMTLAVVKGGLLVTAAVLFCSILMFLAAGPPGTPQFQLTALAREMVYVGQSVVLVTGLGALITEWNVHNK